MVCITRASAGEAPGKNFSAPNPAITSPRLIRSASTPYAVTTASSRSTGVGSRGATSRVRVSWMVVVMVRSSSSWLMTDHARRDRSGRNPPGGDTLRCVARGTAGRRPAPADVRFATHPHRPARVRSRGMLGSCPPPVTSPSPACSCCSGWSRCRASTGSRWTTDPSTPARSLLVLLATAALGFRRLWPVTVLLVSAATASAYLLLGYPHGPVIFAVALAVLTAARHCPPPLSAVASLGAYGGLLLALVRGTPAPSAARPACSRPRRGWRSRYTIGAARRMVAEAARARTRRGRPAARRRRAAAARARGARRRRATAWPRSRCRPTSPCTWARRRAGRTRRWRRSAGRAREALEELRTTLSTAHPAGAAGDAGADARAGPAGRAVRAASRSAGCARRPAACGGKPAPLPARRRPGGVPGAPGVADQRGQALRPHPRAEVDGRPTRRTSVRLRVAQPAPRPSARSRRLRHHRACAPASSRSAAARRRARPTPAVRRCVARSCPRPEVTA